MRLAPLAAIAAMLAAASCGSGGGKPATEELDRTGMPTMVTRDVETYISDSGITRYHISTVLWKVFDEAEEPYWKFPDGLFLEKFDDNPIQPLISATSACGGSMAMCAWSTLQATCS